MTGIQTYLIITGGHPEFGLPLYAQSEIPLYNLAPGLFVGGDKKKGVKLNFRYADLPSWAQTAWVQGGVPDHKVFRYEFKEFMDNVLGHSLADYTDWYAE